MCGHAFPHHSLHSGQADAVLILEQLSHRADAPVSKMVNVVVVSKTILQMHIIIYGGDNILLGHMLGHQLMDVLLDGLRQLFRILGKLLQNLSQHGIIHLLVDAEISGIAVHEAGEVNHHVGENLHIPLLGLNVHERNRGILDGIRHLRSHLVSCRRKDLPRGRIHHIGGQNAVPDSVLQCQLLVEFVSAHLGQIISAGIEEHGIDQTLCAFHAERLPGTYLFVQLKETLLIILSSVLGKAGLYLGFVTENLPDLIIGANTQSSNQNGDGHLTGTVHTHIEYIIRIRLVLQPRTPIRNHRAGIEPFSDLVMAYGVINARGTNQLAYDDSFGAIDHESTRLSHQGKVAHKDLMLADLLFFLIIKADSHRQGCRISSISFFTLFNRILHVIPAQLKIHEFQTKRAAVVGYGRDIVEGFPQPLVKEPLIGVFLDFDQIGHLQNLFLPCVAHTHDLGAGNRTYPVLFH